MQNRCLGKLTPHRYFCSYWSNGSTDFHAVHVFGADSIHFQSLLSMPRFMFVRLLVDYSTAFIACDQLETSRQQFSTKSEICDYLIWKWRSVNGKYKNLLNRKRWRRNFNGVHIFDHARLRYGTADIARHRGIKVAGINPEVEIAFEKKTMTMRFQRLHPHLRPCST